jgi:hypothetical protein
MKKAASGLVSIGRQTRRRVPSGSLLAPRSIFFPAMGFTPGMRFMSTEKPDALNLASQALKGRKRITEKNNLAAMREAKEAMEAEFQRSQGFSISSLFSKFNFWVELQDPQKIGKVAALFTNAKGKMGGLWSPFSLGMRKKSFSIPKTPGQHWDHGAPVEDVSLKFMIHSMRYGMPTKEYFKTIWNALNANSNIRVVDPEIHHIFNILDKHTVTKDGKRLITVQEKLEGLNVDQKEMLKSYLKTIGKNIGEIQVEYCNQFTDSLLRTEVKYLVDYADNYKDFYINHRLFHIQRGGAKFDAKEQIIFELLLKLIGTTPSVNAEPLEQNKSYSDIQDKEDIDQAYDALKEMVHTMNHLFKSVKKVYEPAHNFGLLRSSILSGPSRYTFARNFSNETRNNARIQLKGGNTRKRRR